MTSQATQPDPSFRSHACGKKAFCILALAIVCLPLLSGNSKAVQEPTDAPSDFERAIVPLLSQYGCNAAACHGAAGGRGGFELSLFGARPADDYRSIVFAEQGRRVNWDEPESSLLLAKPTATIEHEGDFRFDVGSQPFEQIRSWIAQGTPYGEPLNITHIDVEPEVIRAVDGLAQGTIEVWATRQNGERIKVSNEAIIEVEDSASVTHRGTNLSSDRAGEHRVYVRYDGVYAVVRLLVPHLPSDNINPIETYEERSSLIDRELNSKLAELGLHAAPIAHRSALVRRLFIDLAGRLPTEIEAREAVADARPDATERLIERLLASPDFEHVWTYHLARWLDADGLGDSQSARAFRQTLRDSIANDLAWHDSVDQMIQARGDSHLVGAAGWYRGTTDPRIQAERFSEQILGTRLRCANCHDHPLDRWTQDDYHGLSAIFARVAQDRIVLDRPTGEVVHPRTQTVALTKLPGQSDFDPELTTHGLAEWVQHDSVASWQRDAVQVNRIWSVLMDRGLVHPIDDWRATNPATHPALLKELVALFEQDSRALKPLVRRIVDSQSYRRQSDSDDSTHTDELAMRWHSRRMNTAMSAEILLDAIVQVTEVAERDGEGASLSAAIDLEQRSVTTTSLSTLGRCAVGANCSPSSSAGMTRDLRQGLHWINGPLLNQRLQDPNGWLMRSWNHRRDVEQWLTDSLDDWYWRCFCRPAFDAERAMWRQELLTTDDPKEAEQRLIDLAWATLASREFWSRP